MSDLRTDGLKRLGSTNLTYSNLGPSVYPNDSLTRSTDFWPYNCQTGCKGRLLRNGVSSLCKKIVDLIKIHAYFYIRSSVMFSDFAQFPRKQ